MPSLTETLLGLAAIRIRPRSIRARRLPPRGRSPASPEHDTIDRATRRWIELSRVGRNGNHRDLRDVVGNPEQRGNLSLMTEKPGGEHGTELSRAQRELEAP